MELPELHIIADAHIWGAKSAFSQLPGYRVDLKLVEHHEITSELLGDTDILLTRSSTRVDARLVSGTPVRFAATATIGDDHYDKAWLESAGITWANAAGSSTDSVVEYMVAALLELHTGKRITLPDMTLGVIGVGRIGSELANRLTRLNVLLLLNDPPRARHEGFDSCSIEELLETADLITLHTPLIRDGEHRTEHLVNAGFLSQFKGRGIINTARGTVVDNKALADWLDGDPERFAVFDCWEGEPLVSARLLNHPQLQIATPHIAGHSLDGKAANTQYVYDALCRYLGVDPEWKMSDELPQADRIEDTLQGTDDWYNLHRMVSARYPIARDNREMHSWLTLPDEQRADNFRSFRRHYPVRRSWSRLPLSLNYDEVSPSLASMAGAVGITVGRIAS